MGLARFDPNLQFERLAYSLQQGFPGEGLDEKGDFGLTLPAMREARISRHVHDFRLRPYDSQFRGQLAARHFGHDHIRQKQLDGPLVTTRYFCGQFGAFSLEYGVTATFKQPARQTTQSRRVLDKQYRFRAAERF